jgi:hypothetical protein
MEQIVIENGSLENSKQPIILVKNSGTSNESVQPCPHCHSPIKIIHTRSWDLTTWEEIRWTNPLEAFIPYDGDCRHTSICVKCLLDAISKNNIDTNYIKEEIINEFENIPVFTNIETVLLKQQGWEHDGKRGCTYIKGNDILIYRAAEEYNGWNLNGTSVEFMEQLTKNK